MQDFWAAPGLALVAGAIGYLLGSIPFGLLIARLGGAGDLRKIGSGNIGATNVLRTGRKELAALTLLLDMGKGAVAVLIGAHIVDGGGIIAGVMAFVGHCYPVWLRFAGGKGVATMLGVVAALHWPSGLVFAVVWIGALLLTRYSSVGGMTAAVSAPFSALLSDARVMLPPFTLMALIVVWRHRSNIRRLLAGEEPKVGRKAEKAG